MFQNHSIMKKITLAIAALSLAASASAQRNMGVATSNWSGLQNIYLNPANIADGRAGFVLDLFNIGFGIDNDIIKVNTSQLGTSVPGSGAVGITPGKKMNLVLGGELRLPGIMLAVKKNSFAITTRARFFAQFANFDRQLYDIVSNPPTSAGAPVSLTARDFNATIHAWSEIRFTYAREIYNKGDHFIKGGITAAKLGGIVFTGFRGSVDGTFDPNTLALAANNTDLTMASSVYSSADQLSGGLGNGVSSFLGNKTGKGWGFDLGAVYEYRPNGGPNPDDPGANNYKVRGSISLVDIGSVKYDAASANVRANGVITASDLAENVDNYSDFKSYAASRGFTLDTGIRSTKVKLPTSLILGADYMVTNHVFVNATYWMNMVNRAGNFGNSTYGQLTVTPRFDSKVFSVGLPIGINGMSGFKMGLGLRLGGFYLGSDDIFGVLGSARGVNVYFGAYVPIHKRHNRHKSESSTTSPAAPTAPKS